MDKYRREDDVNDDLGVYTTESYDGLSIRESKGNFVSKVRVRGNSVGDLEFNNRMRDAKDKLSPKEWELMSLILTRGFSLSDAALEMGITKGMTSKYWKRIKAKLIPPNKMRS